MIRLAHGQGHADDRPYVFKPADEARAIGGRAGGGPTYIVCHPSRS